MCRYVEDGIARFYIFSNGFILYFIVDKLNVAESYYRTCGVRPVGLAS